MHGYITTDNKYCGQKAPLLPAVLTNTDEPIVASQQLSFTIYPNPTTGKFTVEQKDKRLFGKVRIEVFGMHGETLMTGEMIGEKKHEFSITDLPQGLYFVKLLTDNYVETFKLVKAR